MKLNFYQIAEFIEKDQLDLFVRSDYGEKFYQDSMIKIREEYGSVSKYITEVILHPLTLTEGKAKPNVLFVKNDYPYDVNEDIDHYLIWSFEPWKDDEEISSYLREKIPGDKFLFFENPIHLRSVKDIFHIHVFSTKKELYP